MHEAKVSLHLRAYMWKCVTSRKKYLFNRYLGFVCVLRTVGVNRGTADVL